ncbi:hypothetical protein [Cohaesibacter celericrescens]|uniref:hypothetical protein n=1 Tax=Cohaesibacter celericrescens TaxID=2067669 RepID=UPI003563E7D2
MIEAIVSLPIAILYLAIVIMSRGLFFLSRSYQIRELNYKIVAMSDIVQSAILFIGRSLSSLYWPTLLGLLISGIAGTLGGTFKISQTVRRLAIQGLSEISRPRFSYVAWKNRRYFLVESWGGFLRSMAQKGTVVLVTATFGPSKAALTSVALLLLLQPMQVVINPAVDVARSKLATLIRNSDKSNDLIIANLTPLAVILIAPFILAFGIMVLLFLAPTLIGEKWQEVNSVIIYMAPVVYALLVARALQSVFSQLSLQGLALSVDLLSTLVLFVTIYLSWSLGFDLTTSFLAAGVALVLTMYFLFAILLLWTGKYNRVRHSV